MNFTELLLRKMLTVFLVVVWMLSGANHSFAQQHDSEIEIPVLGAPVQLNLTDETGEVIGTQQLTFEQLAIDQDEDEIDRSLISNYWIGVRCEKADSTNYSPAEAPEMELTVAGGIKILAVTKDTASEAAGLKEGDVLLRFADQKMNSLNDLYAVIGKTKDTESKIVLVRNGRIIVSEITPQQRPEEKDESSIADSKTLPQLPLWTIEKAYKAELEEKRIPEGHCIQIELVRGKEIQFNVVRGDDTWQADSDSIEKLPKSIQPLAKEIVSKCEPMVEENITAVWNHTIFADPYLHASRLPTLMGERLAEKHRMNSIESKLLQLTKAIETLSSKMDK